MIDQGRKCGFCLRVRPLLEQPSGNQTAEVIPARRSSSAPSRCAAKALSKPCDLFLHQAKSICVSIAHHAAGRRSNGM